MALVWLCLCVWAMVASWWLWHALLRPQDQHGVRAKAARSAALIY